MRAPWAHVSESMLVFVRPLVVGPAAPPSSRLPFAMRATVYVRQAATFLSVLTYSTIDPLT